MRHSVRLWAAMLGVLGASGLVTACIPTPDSPVWSVTTTVDGVDASPGDGVCEMTEGSGDCSLRAAVAEANAGAGGQIVLGAGETYVLDVADSDGDPDLDVSSPIGLRVDQPDGFAAIRQSNEQGLALDVGSSGSVVSARVSPWSIRVAGSASIAQADMFRLGTTVEVLTGGRAAFGHSRVIGFGGPVVRNAGVLLLLYTEVRGLGSSAAIHTETGASTSIGGTLALNSSSFGTGTFLALGSTPHCIGEPVVSLGYNYAGSTDCGLGAEGDVPPGSFAPVGTWPGTLLNFAIPENAPTIDRIPVGKLGCGTTVVLDRDGDTRPVDGDGDGTPACDIGATER